MTTSTSTHNTSSSTEAKSSGTASNNVVQEKVALVTGSGRNIGRAIALALAADGFHVVTNSATNTEAGERVAAEVREYGVSALHIQADVGVKVDLDRIVAQCVERFDAVDVVINNAAIRPSNNFLEMTDEQFQRVMAVDLFAAVYLCRALLPGMMRKGWGRVVNITGMNAIHGYHGRSHVSIAKHGLWGLTKSLAKEFGPHGVTINAISPGPTRSEHPDPQMTQHIKAQESLIPIGRLGEPTEIAALCAFLCSKNAAFVNGQMINCNGGTQT